MTEKPVLRPEFYPNLVVCITWLVTTTMLVTHVCLIVFAGADGDGGDRTSIAWLATKASLILAGIGVATMVIIPIAYRHTYRQRSHGFRQFLKDHNAYLKAKRRSR